ncbi:MAG: carbohydrate ABC transporter permease [Brevinematales bacterium]
MPDTKDITIEKTGGLSLQEQRRRQQMIRAITSYIILALFAIIFILPFLVTVSTSLKYPQDVFDGKIIPQRIISPWWYNFFGRTEMNIPKLSYDGAFFAGWSRQGITPFAQYYINSIIVSVAVVLLQIITCSMAAYAFARLRWPGRDQVFLTYLGTLMVPGVVMMIPVFIMMKNGFFLNRILPFIPQFSLIDTYPALILPGAFSAYGTFMLRQYFLSIPASLEEAAYIDGASRWQILTTIIVPLSKTAISTMAIFTYLFTWNDFMWPLIVTNKDSMKTLPVGLQAFQSTYGSQWHLVMAASLIVIFPLIVVFIIGQRYIVKGIMMTGLK